MEFKDYYRTLGVSRDAPLEQVRKAYRKLARKFHPDVSKEADAERRMKEVNEAYAVLSDPEKRAAYDRLGRDFRPGQEFRPPPDWDAGFEFSGHDFSRSEAADFSEFFSELFGRSVRWGDAGGSAAGRNDHHAKIVLDLEDALLGATRQISLRVPRLDASGRVTLDTRTLNVRIPRGIQERQVIRLAGQGTPAHAGGAPGDLLLEVHFRPHPRLRVDGRDLRLALAVAPWEAALGAIVNVELPGGALRVRIPEGAQSGRALRVRGQGLAGDPPGDLYLDLRIVAPPADSPRARELYETMARELAFDPRRKRED